MSTTPTIDTHFSWAYWQRLIFRLAFVWVGLLIVTFPIPRPYLPDLGKLLLPLTTALAAGVAQLIGLQQPYLPEIASDTTLMYVHIVLMLELALLVSGIWGWLDRRTLSYPKLQYVLLAGARYFLAAAMLSYGFAKVFKTQFYLPEPNILYTPLGEVPRDLLFWSTTGVSHHYAAFTGWVEVLVGVLLLFRPSRLAGGLLGLGVMANVVALNFCYDISVKVYSSLLLLLCLVVVSPDLPRCWALLRGRGLPPSKLWTPQLQGWRRWAWCGIKAVVVCALVWDAVGQHVATSNFNDDLAPRPPYHGAYAVTTFVLDGDTLAPDLRDRQRWRRVFVHREGYCIVQGMDDRMQDYPLTIDQPRQVLHLHDLHAGVTHNLRFDAMAGQLTALEGFWGNDSLRVQLSPLDWRALPLLRGEFHWTSDTM